jgi:hypothetical protein
MKKKYFELPDSFVKGLICKVHVSLNGKKATKELKVCAVKARSIIFIEVDRVNRQNIFRKVDRADIVNFKPTAICEITVIDGILPVKWESGWDAIGSFSPAVQSYGRFATAANGKPYSNNGHGSYNFFPTTTNSAAGFPMV